MLMHTQESERGERPGRADIRPEEVQEEGPGLPGRHQCPRGVCN